MLSLTMHPIQSIGANSATPKSATLPTSASKVQVRAMEAKLYEINAIDKSNLTASEKRVLRKEVKAINSQMRIANNGGVYLSAGAIILIVILLIILL